MAHDARLDVPVTGDPMRFYLEARNADTLLFQRCDDCGHVQSYPRVACAHCHRGALRWERSSQRGRIVSSTTVHRAANPAFQARAPYQLALVDLEEGFRLMLDVDGADRPAIGARVRIEFFDTADGRRELRGVVE